MSLCGLLRHPPIFRSRKSKREPAAKAEGRRPSLFQDWEGLVPSQSWSHRTLKCESQNKCAMEKNLQNKPRDGMLIGRQIRGDERLNIHESNQELRLNAEMVLVVTTGSTERRLLPEKVQRDVSQTCSTGQASWDISLGPTVWFLSSSITHAVLGFIFPCHGKFLLPQAERRQGGEC